MTKKARFIIFSLIGFMSIIGIFIFIMTWFYPYSFFSIDKSYDYEPYYISSNGAEYSELINEFKNSYEKDLEADSKNKDTNLTIDRTQYVLPLFEQDWLVSKEPLPFDELKLDTILLKVKQSKEILMELLIQVDYTSEQKGYLVHCVKNFETLEDSIIEMKNDKYATKGELNRQFDTLFSNFLYSFDSFVTFYTRSK